MFNYDNIGEKIKGLAKFFFISGTISSILLGLFMLQNNTIRAILIIVLGTIGSWLSSFTLYGFGEIIVKLTEIELNTRGEGKDPISLKIKAIETTSKRKEEEKALMEKMKNATPSTSKFCPHCGERVTSNICSMCGKNNNLFDK